MMVVRYRNREEQGEENDLVLPNRIHLEDDQTLQDGSGHTAPGPNKSWTQPYQNPIPIRSSGNRGDEACTVQGSHRFPHVCGHWNSTGYHICSILPGQIHGKPRAHTHWEAVKCVIRYLKGTKHAKLILGKGGMLTWEELNYQNRSGMQGYSNADGNSQEHHHAISG